MSDLPSRGDASAATAHLGWRYLLGMLRTGVRVTSMAEAADVASVAVEACGGLADHLRVDLRPSCVDLSLYPPGRTSVTAADTELAAAVTAALGGRGWTTIPAASTRTAQVVEIAVDAADAAAVRPFWKAILGYADELPGDGPTAPIVDPLWQGPAVWFQTMEPPRTQRNRIHLDICVPHDEADRRIAAALDAGGRIVLDRGPAFRVLADPEGNEACVTTWQGRD